MASNSNFDLGAFAAPVEAPKSNIDLNAFAAPIAQQQTQPSAQFDPNAFAAPIEQPKQQPQFDPSAFAAPVEKQQDQQSLPSMIGEGIVNAGKGLVNAPISVLNDVADAGWKGAQAVGLEPQDQQAPHLPTFDVSNSAIGTAAQDVGRLATYAIPGGAVARAVGLTGAVATVVGGAIADQLASKSDAPTIGNMLANTPIIGALATNPNDPALVNRAKLFLQDVGLGAAFEGVLKGVRALRGAGSDAASVIEPKAPSPEAVVPGTDEFQTTPIPGVNGVPGELPDVIRGPEVVPAPTMAPEAPTVTAGGPPGVPATPIATNATIPPTAAPEGLTSAMGSPIQSEIRNPELMADTSPNHIANINLTGNSVIDDAFVQAQADATNNFLEARRGVFTDFELGQAAIQAGPMTKEQLLQYNPGQGATELDIARLSYTDSVYKSQAAAFQANPGLLMEAGGAQALIQNATMRSLINFVRSGAAADAGRTLRAFQMFSGTFDPEMNSLLSKIPNAPTDTSAASVAQMIFNLDKQGAPGASEQLMKNLIARPVTPWGMVQEFYTNALLSGPKTWAVVLFGNVAKTVLSVPEKWIQSGAGAVRYYGLGPLLGRQMDRGVSFRQAYAYSAGMFQGMGDALTVAKNAFVDGVSTDFRGQVESHGEQIPGKLGTAVRSSGRVLMTLDAFTGTLGQRMYLNMKAVDAYEDAIAAGQKVDYTEFVNNFINPMNVPKDLANEATQWGKSMSFTNDLGYVGTKIQNAVASNPFSKALLPFVRAPINMAKYTAQLTGLNALALPFDMLGGVRKGTEDAAGKTLAPWVSDTYRALTKGGADADLVAARWGMGAIGAGIVAGLAAGGQITGAPPEDPRDRMRWDEQGIRPYSIKVGDNWYTYNRLDPIAGPFALFADFGRVYHHALPDGFDGDIFHAIDQLKTNFPDWSLQATNAIKEHFMSKEWLGTVAGVVDAMSNENKMATMANNFVKGFVPNLFGTIARTIDPVKRAPQNPLEAVQTMIPGASNNVLPVRHKLLGDPTTRDPSLGDSVSPLLGLFSPVAVSPESKDPITNEVNRLKVQASLPATTIDGYKMSPQEYDQYMQLRGQGARYLGNKLLADPQYAALPDNMKRVYWDKIFSSADRYAAQTLLKTDPQAQAGAVYKKYDNAYGQQTPQPLLDQIESKYGPRPYGAKQKIQD